MLSRKTLFASNRERFRFTLVVLRVQWPNGPMALSKSFVFKAFWLNMTIPTLPTASCSARGRVQARCCLLTLELRGEVAGYIRVWYTLMYIYICHTCIQTSKHISWHLCIYTSLPIFGPLLSIAIMLFQTFLLSVLVVRIDSLLLRRTCVAAGSAGHWF